MGTSPRRQNSPPSRNSALPWAPSLSFLTKHWYMPRSDLVTPATWSTSWDRRRIREPEGASPSDMGSTGSPFRNHHTDSIGDPETEQLNVAESPEFTTCENGIRRHYCWSLTLREERRLQVFENGVLRKIFGPKREELTGDWRILYTEELRDVYSHAPHNDISLNNGPHIWQWSHKIMILLTKYYMGV